MQEIIESDKNAVTAIREIIESDKNDYAKIELIEEVLLSYYDRINQTLNPKK